MKEHTKAYVAGLVDAEGTLSIELASRYDCVTSYARLSISNTERRIHKYLVQMFGGQFSLVNRDKAGRPKYWKPEYRWTPTGMKHSSWFLSQIHPYLRIKRKEANLLLEYYSMNGIQSPAYNRRRKELIQRSNELKDRSVETDIQKVFWKNNLINAYFAGLCDGDGCVSIKRQPLNSYFVYSGLLNLVNTHGPLIHAAEATYGGRSRLRTEQTDRRMPSYEWATRNKQLIKLILLKWLPYLVIKREQAKILLQFVQHERIVKSDVDPNRHDFREALYQKMYKLNHPEH